MWVLYRRGRKKLRKYKSRETKSKQTVQEGRTTTKEAVWPPITLLSVFEDFMQNLARRLDGIVGDAVQVC